MKTAKFITLCFVLLSILSYSDAMAQHRDAPRRAQERQHRNDHHDAYRNRARDHGNRYKKNPKYAKKQIKYHQKHYSHCYPKWASAHRYRAKHHVYFRDYCTFYDPHRGGYVYWSSNRWVFSRSVPAFLAHVDLGRARIQLMANVPLDRHPEYYYKEYVHAYPRSTNIQINLSLPPL
ncbi:hypothetical protein [Olivibacter sp. XZL3]|uniref:hypothetical protein n=1 Tax=Olivibacter sp. XZL3 TaxID=1735116 RepID=UPI0010646CA9|nr:hypothetical protein [Olivibacter sp. XZL3]